MKQPWVIVGAVILALLGGGVWWMMSNNVSAPSATVQPVASTSKNESAVTIGNGSFSPATITVKKGTKVIWTNQDTVKHNVVADDATNSGGLPATHDLLAKDETFEHTFDQTGTFNYHCMPHPFMKGVVEVTE